MQDVDDCLKDCQSLLALSPCCHGWLKSSNKVFSVGESLSSRLNEITPLVNIVTTKLGWHRRYVILHDTYLFIFQQETSKKAEKIIRLSDYKSITSYSSDNPALPWPFRLIKKRNSHALIFGANFKADRSKWMEALQPLVSNNADDDTGNNYDDVHHMSFDDLDDEEEEEEDGDDDDNEDYDQPDTLPGRKFVPLPEIPKEHTPYKGHRQNTENKTPFHQIPLPKKPPAPKPTTQTLPTKPHKKVLPPKPPTQTLSTKTPPKPPTTKPLLKISSIKTPPPPKSAINSIPEEPSSENTFQMKEVYACGHVQQALSELAMWNGGKDEANEVMKKLCGQNGVYMVRKATDNSDNYTLAVLDDDVTRKFQIKVIGDKLTMSNESFDNLDHLLDHFSIHPLPNKSLALLKPYKLALEQA